MNTVEELIAKHEGRKATQYLDSVGIPTIGIGHNMQVCPLPPDWTQPLTDEQIDQLFAEDLAKATMGLVASLPWTADLDPVRGAVLIDMAFNMGIATLLTFHHTLGFFQARDWVNAAAGMLASKWHAQVGARAQEDATMVLTGLWPGACGCDYCPDPL